MLSVLHCAWPPLVAAGFLRTSLASHSRTGSRVVIEHMKSPDPINVACSLLGLALGKLQQGSCRPTPCSPWLNLPATFFLSLRPSHVQRRLTTIRRLRIISVPRRERDQNKNPSNASSPILTCRDDHDQQQQQCPDRPYGTETRLALQAGLPSKSLQQAG